MAKKKVAGKKDPEPRATARHAKVAKVEQVRPEAPEATEPLEQAALEQPQVDEVPEAETARAARDFGSVTVSLENAMPSVEVMATSSEEFRESLQTLQGSLELLISGKVLDLRKSKKLLGIAYREAEYLNNRVSDLQVAATIESGRMRLKLTGLELSALLNSVVEKLSPTASENEVEVEIVIGDKLPTVRADESLQNRLFTNLIERCIKAAPAKGKVLITVELVGEYVEVQIVSRGESAPSYVEIQLGEASERGLALYVADQIAYAHEGELTFLGMDQEIKAVTLTLPVQLKGRGRGKILVVDDNPQAATLLEYALEEEGYEAIKALNGLEGLKLARSERVDLVILDILLPGIDGYEVCHRLRAAPETASTPIIMISAKAREEDRATAMRIGADAYFGKPLGMAELMKAIQNLLEEGDAPGWSPD